MEDADFITDKLEQLSASWTGLQSESHKRRQLLENTLGTHRASAEKYKELHDAFNAWLTDTESHIKAKREALTLKQQLEEMKVKTCTKE